VYPEEYATCAPSPLPYCDGLLSSRSCIRLGYCTAATQIIEPRTKRQSSKTVAGFYPRNSEVTFLYRAVNTFGFALARTNAVRSTYDSPDRPKAVIKILRSDWALSRLCLRLSFFMRHCHGLRPPSIPLEIVQAPISQHSHALTVTLPVF
jgi:hypothetical protein